MIVTVMLTVVVGIMAVMVEVTTTADMAGVCLGYRFAFFNKIWQE